MSPRPLQIRAETIRLKPSVAKGKGPTARLRLKRGIAVTAAPQAAVVRLDSRAGR